MRSIMFRLIVAATAAFTAACGTDAFSPTTPPASARQSVSPGNAGATPVSRTIDQYLWVSCTNGGAGEVIRITGELRYDFQTLKDSAGVYHLSLKSNTFGLTAVGLTTGTFFRGFMTERVNSRAVDYLNMDLRAADIIRFVSPASGDAYSLMVTSRFIVDEGTYVLWEQTWNEVCR